jgi:hypothetical protein
MSPSVDLPFINTSYTIQTGKNTGYRAKSFCLEPNKLIAGQPIKIKVCNGSDVQSWDRVAKGQFRNIANPLLCLKNIERKLKIGSCVDGDDIRFGYDWFDSTFAMKKKPFLVATAPSDAFKENLSISLDPRIEDNDMQEFTLVPDNGSFIPVPPKQFAFQSKISFGGDYCLEPMRLKHRSDVKPLMCNDSLRQQWIYNDGYFKSAANEGLCMANKSDVLQVQDCPINKNKFMYDFLDYTLSSRKAKLLVTIVDDLLDPTVTAVDTPVVEIIKRNVAAYPNGGQQWFVV